MCHPSQYGCVEWRTHGDLLRRQYVLHGDFDCDNDIDLDDYASFAACLTGPAAGLPPGCGCGDFDGDDDVDMLDFAEFQVAFTGSNP